MVSSHVSAFGLQFGTSGYSRSLVFSLPGQPEKGTVRVTYHHRAVTFFDDIDLIQ